MRCASVALLVFVLSSVASAGSALDKPAFTATPAELLAEAKKAPASDTGVKILRVDEDITFDEHGLATDRVRYVVAIASQEGLEDWESIYRSWRPWNQSRPVLRARVIAGSGQVTDLDASKLSESVGTGERREVSGPLPLLQIGSVLEEEVSTADTAPVAGGRALNVEITSESPTHVTVTAPVSLKVHVFERALAVKPRHTVSGARETWSYTIGALAAQVREPEEPDDQHSWPTIEITTSPSWAAVAKGYAAAIAPHLTVALPAGLPHGATRETAAAVTAWLHDHVRFTGVDLNAGPIDTLDLDAVLKRSTANAHEISALLAALLRAAGCAPELVLVNRGWPHFDRDRPSLYSFDHALVRVPLASGELWIDPEELNAPVGQLGSYDQGRLALAVDRGALVTVPMAPATANTVREVRTYEVAQIGRGKLREVSHEGGVFEAAQRGWVRDHPAAAVHKQLEKYVADTYRGTLGSYTTTPPDDLGKPFEMTIDVPDTSRTLTQWSHADVYLFPSHTFARLSHLLSTKADEPRAHDLVLRDPHIYEIENHIIVPAGFTVPTPQAERTRAVGAFKLIERQRVEGHGLVVTYRLEADATRLTPAQVNETRKAIDDIREDSTHLVLEQTGWSLISHGKFRQGLAELDRLIAAEPTVALHRARRAQAMLMIGDGDGARREARKAVELDPKSVHAYISLGWVLEHDLAGRRFAPGHDHAGARAALMKARELDPGHVGAAVELASLLERDERGRKYESSVADLRAAADAWRAANEIEATEERGLNGVRALLYAGDATAAEKTARALPQSAMRDALLVTAVAMTSGADAAVRAAPQAGRDAALQGATGMLMLVRQYDLMRKMAAETNLVQANTAQAAMIQHLQRFDAPFKPTADPKDLALGLAFELLDPTHKTVVFWDAGVAKDVLATERKAAMPETEGMTTSMLADLMRSSSTTRVDGDGNAWRVEVEIVGKKESLFAANDHGIPKVIGTPSSLQGVGAHVLRLIGKHDDAAARLLDWAVKEGHRRELSKVWGGSLPRDTTAMTIAGALLAADPDREVAVGTRCGATTSDGQLVCDMMVVEGLRKRRKWNELLAFIGAWSGRVPSFAARLPEHEQIRALLHLGNIDEAEHAIDDALAKHPDDVELLELRAEAGTRHARPDELASRMDALVQASPDSGSVLNNVAWMKVAVGVDLPGALDEARKAVEIKKTAPWTANTLAAVEAETGDLRAAVLEIQRAIQLSHEDQPPAADWYVLGRIYELAGLRDDAIAAYKRVTPVNSDDLTPHADALAAARLTALGVKK